MKNLIADTVSGVTGIDYDLKDYEFHVVVLDQDDFFDALCDATAFEKDSVLGASVDDDIYEKIMSEYGINK